MNILGISAFYHDSAACLLRDGEIVAAAQEERFTRKKHDYRFPEHAIAYCLQEAGINADALDHVVFYDKPFLKFERLLESYIAYAPKGFGSFLKAMPVWIRQKLFMRELIHKALPDYKGKMLFSSHHESHAASAFFPSPFAEAAIFTADGVGEWATTTIGVGTGNRVEIIREIQFPHSLGLLYSAFTYYTGFKVNSGEYKVMGLAPYGEPKYVDLIYEHLIDLKEDGSFKLNMDYFNYAAGLTMTNGKFDALFGGPPRQQESKLTQKEMDLARSIQVVTEEAMLRSARYIHRLTGMRNLCLAGGVALNCVGNGRILREGPFKDMWIQPASGDAGGALGAATLIWHHYLDKPRAIKGKNRLQKATYLGPEYSRDEIKAFLDEIGAPYTEVPLEEIPERTAELVASEKVIGWFEGRMEFGPRALGARSIIGDARSSSMQEVMNLKIKFRESFRPFAPSVLVEHVADWFETSHDSPYMLLVANVRKERCRWMTSTEENLWGLDKLKVVRSEVPAITHVDYSARLQTVDKDDAPLYHAMIQAFYNKTACPVIINTSFNVRGEPIVCAPKDAYICFMRTKMDYLVMGPFIIDKSNQKPLEKDSDWMREYELD
ncbi:MAG: hypothetical protein C4523_16855 [Myxococcales bacterium]|nr:MAG: hypothetical protein C4523_16855 [Myxococcales bacterium]